MLIGSITAIFHLLIPTLLFVWLLSGTSRRSRAEWLFGTMAGAAYLATLNLAAAWMALPWWLGYVFLGLWLVAASERVWRFRASSQTWRPWWSALWAILFASFTVGAIHALLGHRQATDMHVDLAFPLHDGTYYIANGGSNLLVNLHITTLAPRLRAFRGQSYGVDIVKLNGYSIRADSPWPRKLGDYEIFGDTLHAPCTGIVERMVDGLPDLVPPQLDRVNLAGNHVAIRCKGVRVLLAHMQRDSIQVQAGERVTEGQTLGRVGNSGNTSEPHLHIHAERPSADGGLLDADPVAMRFNGRFLARNDRVNGRSR